jgi:hypothetical protein
MQSGGKSIDLGPNMEKTSGDMESYLTNEEDKVKKDYKFTDKSGHTKTYNVLLPIYIRNTIHHKSIDDYSGEELGKSVFILNTILSKK